MTSLHAGGQKAKPQHIWAGALLAILTILCYTLLFFAIIPEKANFEIEQDQYFISLIFLLITTLILVVTQRTTRQKEKVLLETQQQYFELVEHAADPIIILDEFGTIISANSAVKNASEYAPSELTGRHFLKINILTGMGIATAAREFLYISGGAKRPPFELTMLKKNGAPFIMEAHAQKIKDANENTLVHVTLRDITDRKKAEEMLRLEKNRAQNYLNIASVMLLTLDQTGKVLMINKKGCEILGYAQDDILGKNWFEKFIPPEESADMQAFFSNIIAAKEQLPSHHENTVITKNGQKRIISWKNSLLFDDNKILGTLSSGEDITEKQAIETQLHLQSTALEVAANVIVITDKYGQIAWANKAFSEISGYSREEALGKNPRILKSGLHTENFYSDMWNTIIAGNIWHGEIVNRRKDDRLYTEEMTITPVRGKTGEITHFIAIKRDITERKRLQQNLEQSHLELEAKTRKLERSLIEIDQKNQQLQQAQAQLIQSEKLSAIGVLSSGIAHEIKNPLAIISLSIEEFEAISEKLDDQSKSFIQMIKRAADRANNVIIELLRFARVSDLKVGPVNLFDLVEGTFVLIQNSSKFKGINLKHEYTDKNIIISADRILIEQVLFNLLLNAIDSTERGQDVTVKTYHSQKTGPDNKTNLAVIEVIDRGCGIPPEILPKIFEPFFTTKEQGAGTGLGLSTVYTLLKRHNGTIDVESAVGSGTKFTVTLPCADEKPL